MYLLLLVFLRTLVCDMVAILLSLFLNIKNFLVPMYSQKLNMLDWQKFFFKNWKLQQAVQTALITLG